MTEDRFEEFGRNAREAERQAARAKLPEEREAYLRIAQGWRELIESAGRETSSILSPKHR